MIKQIASNQNSNKGLSTAAWIYVLVFGFVISVSIFKIKPDSIIDICRYWSPILIAMYALFLYSFYVKYKTLNFPFVYFITTALLCWFGQVIVLAMGLTTESPLIISTFKADLLGKAVLYSTFCFYILSIIALFYSNKTSYKNFSIRISDPVFKRSMNVVGIFFSCISGYAYFSQRVFDLFTSLRYGYAAIYQDSFVNSGNGSYSAIVSLKMLFVPSVFILLIANKDNVIIRNILYTILLISISISFMTGGRGEALALIIGLFWIYSNEISKIDLKRLIAISGIGVVLIKLITIIAKFRISADRSLDGFLAIAAQKTSEGFVTSILREFGFNIFSVYQTMILVPSTQDYSNGYSYFASVMSIVPRVVFGGYSFAQDAGLSGWLMKTLHLNYGPGYSIVAESYYNFGWLGIIPIALLGIILAKMFINKNIDQDQKSLRNGFIAIILYSNLFIARDTSLFVLRKYIYAVLLPYVAIYIVFSIYKKAVGKE